MTHPIDYVLQPPLPFANRRGGVIAFGVISIVLGSLAGCMSLLAPLAVVAMRMAPPQAGAAVRVGDMVLGILMYAALAAGLIWWGVGACLCRRWVRPVALCIAWPWIVMAAPMTILMVLAVTRVQPPPGAPPMPPMVRTMTIVGTAVVALIFYLLLPGAYAWFFGRQNVKLTLEHYDPRPRWTDRCPMPVLGMCIWLVISAVSLLATAGFYPVLPVFGTFVVGLPAAVLIVLLSGLLLLTARLCYRVRPAGWWLSMALATGGALTYAVTMHLAGLAAFYEAAELPEEQIAAFRQTGMSDDWLPALLGLGGAAAVLGYHLYVRRYFNVTMAHAQVDPSGG